MGSISFMLGKLFIIKVCEAFPAFPTATFAEIYLYYEDFERFADGKAEEPRKSEQRQR